MAKIFTAYVCKRVTNRDPLEVHAVTIQECNIVYKIINDGSRMYFNWRSTLQKCANHMRFGYTALEAIEHCECTIKDDMSRLEKQLFGLKKDLKTLEDMKRKAK